MGADVSVQSGQTVVLGGLTQNSVSKTQTKVPLLGDIPLLGWLFRSETDKQTRTELVVFITPRVLNTPEQIEDFTRGMKAGMDTDGVWDPTKSISRIADPVDQRTARKVLERGKNTIAPPQYPLTGFLTGLNDDGNLPADVPATETLRRAREKAEENGTVPYVHFSDVDGSVMLPPSESALPAETPDVPETEEIPENPEVPETPEVPEAPAAAETPEPAAETPEVPETPAAPVEK